MTDKKRQTPEEILQNLSSTIKKNIEINNANAHKIVNDLEKIKESSQKVAEKFKKTILEIEPAMEKLSSVDSTEEFTIQDAEDAFNGLCEMHSQFIKKIEDDIALIEKGENVDFKKVAEKYFKIPHDITPSDIVESLIRSKEFFEDMFERRKNLFYALSSALKNEEK